MRVAVYPSVLYGFDWIQESLRSILPYVDRIYVVMQTRPWGATDGVLYQEQWVDWPDRFDNTRELVVEVQAGIRRQEEETSEVLPAIEIIEDVSFSPWDRWAHGVNLVRKCCSPDDVVTLDPDCVFSEEEAQKTFADWDAHPEYVWAQPRQVELWKTPEWMVVRPRSMVAFCRGDLDLLSSEVRKARGGGAPHTHVLDGTVHNLGFACSDKTMYWKHLTSLAFSPVVGESLPNPDWYDQKWLAWTPETRNLEPAARCEGSIPRAVPYSGPPVPGSVRRRFDKTVGGL